MTFLNPAILWGLAAISIPIIIHIFNLKRTKKIEFSTLMFLKEIQQSRYKKIKLKQLLILLSRIAFIIFLVMLFAHPFQKGYLGAGQKAKSSVLLVLDDSFSMQTRDNKGSDFDNAKAKLLETINILDKNDEVFFTTVSKIDRTERSIQYKDFNQLRDSVSKTKTSDITRNLPEVLYFANKILESSSHAYKEVYLFTDGQKSFIENPANLPAELKTNDETKLNIVLTGSRNGNNLSLDTINVITKIFEKNKTVKLKCTINNHNNFNVTNKSIVLNYDGNKNYRDEKAIDIAANSSVDVEFNFVPNKTGFASGSVELLQNEISDDEISSDNKRFFGFYIPEKINLLMVSSSPSDLSYINLALTSSEELMKDSTGNSLGFHTKFFEIKQVSENDLGSQELKNFNCVLIANKTTFSSQEADKLFNYVENGGGLIIFPGTNTNIQNYNEVLLKKLDMSFINSSFQASTTGRTQSFLFDKIDYEHPIFDGVFKQSATQNNISKESPEIKYGLNLTTDKNSISLITLNNEKNFLVEYSRGKGKVLLFSVSPDMKNSDFPARSIFSPITVRSVLYLSNTNTIKSALSGKDYFLDLSTLNIPSNTDTINVSSVTYPPEKYSIGIQTGLHGLVNLKKFVSYTSLYNVTAGNNLVYQFPSNFDKRESNTEKTDVKLFQTLLKDRYKIDANVIEPNKTISASILELRTGREIWQYFLILALIFVLIEYLLANSILKGINKPTKSGKNSAKQI